MEVTAKLSNFRTSPRKVRQVADLVRGKNATQAEAILLFTVNKSARHIEKLLHSAMASAKHDFQLDALNLYVSKITVDEGPKLKRWHPMSRGRAYPIIKRTSHIVLVLSERVPTVKEAKNTKIEKIKTPKVKKVVKAKTEKSLPNQKQTKVKKEIKTKK